MFLIRVVSVLHNAAELHLSLTTHHLLDEVASTFASNKWSVGMIHCLNTKMNDN